MQIVNSLGLSIGVKLNYPHAPIIGPHIFSPYTILIGLAVIPEARALHFTKSRGNRRKVSITTTFPVHILKAHPFLLRNRRSIVIAQNNKPFFSKSIAFKVHQSQKSFLDAHTPSGYGRKERLSADSSPLFVPPCGEPFWW